MRLLFLEWTLTSKFGGMETCLFEECVQLRRLGHDVTVAYNETGDLQPLYEEANVKVLPMFPYAPRRGHVVSDALGLATNLSRSLPLPLDLVIANSYHSTFFGGALARLRRLPLVCHLRLNPPSSVSWPTRAGLREVSRFIAESESVRDLWMERGIDPRAIDVVHDGVDVTRFRPVPNAGNIRSSLGLSNDDFVIFSGGRIDPVKDLEGLLRTFAMVRQRMPNAHLVLAGAPTSLGSPRDGQRYLEQLKSLAATLRIASAVRWVGHRSDMPELYAAADSVALFGSIPEPFGKVTCEALACGRPMVTPRQGGSVEILTGEFSKFLFQPGDYNAAAAILLDLAGWQQRDPDFVRRAREHVCRRFQLAEMGRRIEVAMATAIKNGPQRNGPSYDCFRDSASRRPMGKSNEARLGGRTVRAN